MIANSHDHWWPEMFSVKVLRAMGWDNKNIWRIMHKLLYLQYISNKDMLSRWKSHWGDL